MSGLYDDVLVPTDGSDAIDETLDHALAIAADNDATVHALYVIDTRMLHAARDETADDLEATLAAEGENAVAAVREAAADRGLDAATEVRRGTPAKRILGYADDAAVDLIVIGTRGKTPREKVTVGSVSERVVGDASTPVLVVRNVGDS